MGWRRCLGLVLAVLERRGEGLTVSSDGELAAALANCSNATLDGASFALAETAVLRGANCRVVVDGSAAAAPLARGDARRPPRPRPRRPGRRARAEIRRARGLRRGERRRRLRRGLRGDRPPRRLRRRRRRRRRVADGAALVAVGGSYAGGGYAFAAHGASATVDGGAYAGGGVLRLEAARRAVVGGTFANGTTAVDAADSNVTVRGGAFGFAGPVLRAREAAPSSSSAGPTTARRPTAAVAGAAAPWASPAAPSASRRGRPAPRSSTAAAPSPCPARFYGSATAGPATRSARSRSRRGGRGGEATAPALKCIFRACEKAALGGRTLADVTDVLRARVACPTAAAVAAAVRGAPGDGAALRRRPAALAAAPWSSVVCLELQLDGVVAELAVAHAALDAVDPCVEINQ
ncbi:hypothetical protein JL720_14850 [Aureococcus anophagefferens]|nr:hypothetical protein JL720_14850 [Aureococcus anophagefferens]